MAEVAPVPGALATVRPRVVVISIAQVGVVQTTAAPTAVVERVPLAAQELSLFPTFQLQHD